MTSGRQTRLPPAFLGAASNASPDDHVRVAVVIVNWNSGALLVRCLEALARQTRQPDSVIVYDNASTDLSLEGLDRFTGTQIIKSPTNLGFAAANNRAIESTDCDWIATLNPDAFPETTWLDALMRAVAERPGYACFASRMIMDEDRSRLDGAGDVYHLSGLAWRRGHGALESGLYTRAEEVFAPCAGAALYRRDTFLALGGFDETFFCYMEDVDLGFRLRLAGHSCLYLPDAVVYHIGSALTGKRSDFSVYHGHRNLEWVYLTNMPTPLLLLTFPIHALMILVTLLRFVMAGQARVYLQAKTDALKGFPRAWARRAPARQRTLTTLRLVRRMSLNPLR